MLTLNSVVRETGIETGFQTETKSILGIDYIYVQNFMQLVSWCLTSLSSTNMAISQTKGHGWRAIPTQYRKATDILTPPWPPFCSAAIQKGKGIERLI